LSCLQSTVITSTTKAKLLAIAYLMS
jgi:hypothetical protein